MALRDILDLPAEVKKSDFVIRLNEGVAHPRELIGSYAVTPDIRTNLGDALTLIHAAIRERKSEATYLEGSFGAGKSHFMAVLSLMLANDPDVWGDSDLHALRAKHDWVKTTKILRLHFNMINSRSTEERLYGGYLALVREQHPHATLPPLFEDQALFDNAQHLRTALGDTAFFATLNGKTGDSASVGASKVKAGWGTLGSRAVWDGASLDQARTSSELSDRERLLSALVRSHFPAFADNTASYVALEVGLPRLAEHAKALGYQGIVVFLDELILWLASRAGDKVWLGKEVEKLSKFVETNEERALGIVAVIARQRDVREMIGDQFAGIEMQNLSQLLQWWEGRFNKIQLQDRNLPAIVEKRVVRARNDAARKELDTAFDRMRASLGQAWTTLLGDIGDEKAFRQVYPFSPALIEVLVAISSYLQRERTALKILVELLVEHLTDFEMGRVVPVGDLYDVLAGGEEPMDGTLRERFVAAKRLYETELLPRIQADNGTVGKDQCQRLREDHPVSLGCSNCAKQRCRADNRIVKTLLLAALGPEVKPLRQLTMSRLVQLNHGTLRSSIPGNEASGATTRLRAWGLSKLRFGDEQDPRVWISLEGVDLRPVLDSARGVDSPGARRRMLREILFEGLGLPASDDATVAHRHPDFRGTRREGVIQYGNVRELDDVALQVPSDVEWKLVIDYPFDDPPHTPDEDEARLGSFVASQRAMTVVWLPSFFGERVRRDLADLVVIRSVLADGGRTYLAGLRPDDQRRAKDELEYLVTQKRLAVLRALNAAYGLKRPDEGELDLEHVVEQHLHVLTPGWKITGVTETVLSKAIEKAVGELLALRYPRHPHLAKVTPARLRSSYEKLESLCEADGQRMAVARAERSEWELLEGLGIIELSEAWATVRGSWVSDLDRVLRQDGLEQAPTVAQIKKRLDPDGVRGLPSDVSDLEVLCYALAARRDLRRAGRGVDDAMPGRLGDDVELIQTPLPDERSWQEAIERAGKLFGVSIGGRARNARNLRKLSEHVRQARARAVAQRAVSVADLLERRSAVGQSATASGDVTPRSATAMRVAELFSLLDTHDVVALATQLGSFEVAPSTLPAMAKHLASAEKVASVLDDDVLFGVLEALVTSSVDSAGARDLAVQARRALVADELTIELAPELRRIGVEAQRLRAPVALPRPETSPAGGGGSLPAPIGSGSAIVQRQGEGLAALEAALAEARKAIEDAGPDAKLTFSWQVTKP